MTISGNKKLSRNRKRRNDRRIKIDDKLKSLLNKIKTEKKKKNKNIDRIKAIEIELVKIKYANNPNKLQSELKELNKIHVIDKNLHEIKNEILLAYVGEFKMVGSLKVGDQIRQTLIRFRNMDDFESYINAIGERYDAEDAIFKGYIYKKDTPQFNRVNRSQYGSGCDFKHEIVEYLVISCLNQLKATVLSNVLFALQFKITNNNT